MMKQFLQLLILLVVSYNLAAQTTEKVTGKWAIVKMRVDGLDIDPANPAKTKKDIATQMEKESGTEPDASFVDEAYQELVVALKSSSFEFTADGKAITRSKDGDDDIEDVGKYTVDYKKGILVTVHTDEEDQSEFKRTSRIKFVNGLLIMQFNKDEDVSVEEMTLKRIK